MDSTHLANWIISFEIDDTDGNRIYVGYFDSNEQVVAKVTDANGVATDTYSTPLALELPAVAQITVYIRATVWLGEIPIYAITPIYIYGP